MKIQGKLAGDMIGFALKHNPENGVRFANVRIAVNVDRDDCDLIFGPGLGKLAFGSMSEPGPDADDGATFGYKKLEPSEICEFHEISFVGKTRNSQPVVKSIAPVKGEAKVLIVVEVPFMIGEDKEIAGAMCAKFGEIVEMEFNPSQRELPMDGANSGAVVIKPGAFGNPAAVGAG